MEFSEVIKKRRSVRSYDSAKPVLDADVKYILETAILAPSAGNSQCWRFFVVRGKKMKEKLVDAALGQSFIADAPVVIVVTADLDHIEKSYGLRGRETYAIQDTAAAIEHMLLAAADRNLGTCWIGAFNEGKAASALGLPKNLRPLAMVPIGHPADDKKRPARRPVDEVVKWVD